MVQRYLKEKGEQLLGLFPGNPTRGTARPTAERILKAFQPLSLTIVKVKDEEYGHISPLNSLQQRILELLGSTSDIYSSLEGSPS